MDVILRGSLQTQPGLIRHQPLNCWVNLTSLLTECIVASHVDSWCKRTCDPNLFPELAKVMLASYHKQRAAYMSLSIQVDTEICE